MSRSHNKSLNRYDDSDDSIQQVMQALLQRKPHFVGLLKSLLNLGLPVLDVEPNQRLISTLGQNQFNLRLLQRFISIDLEGKPSKLTKTNLALNIKDRMHRLKIPNYSKIQLEELLGLVNGSCQPIQYNKKGFSANRIEGKFDFQSLLDRLNMDDVIIVQKLNLISTDVFGYYEVKNIQDLKDYGDMELFQQVRRLRQAIMEIIKSLYEVVESFDSKVIQKIEDAVINYIDLKKNIVLPFTIRKQINYDDIDIDTMSSAKSSQSKRSVAFSKQICSSCKSKRKVNSSPQSILKSNKVYQAQIQSIIPIKEESDSSQKKEEVSKKPKIMKGRKSKVDSQTWDEFQQNNFENIFYQQVDNMEITSSKKEPQIEVSSRRKKLLKQMKHQVCFDVFDSNQYYDCVVLQIKYVNPRAPFKKYSFIDYDIDSEEEEDVNSEMRSIEGSPTSSMQEFLTIDYKNPDYQLNEQPSVKIQDESNFEYFTQFKAILITTLQPQLESTKKSKLSSKQVLKNLIIEDLQLFQISE